MGPFGDTFFLLLLVAPFGGTIFLLLLVAPFGSTIFLLLLVAPFEVIPLFELFLFLSYSSF